MPGARKKSAVPQPAAHREAPPPSSAPPPFESVGDWHLPTEIRRFFRSRIGQSLLIRGAPGTGKTTFALSLLAGLKTPGFYVSTRVFYPELVEHYPWLQDQLPEDHVVDAEALWPGAEGRKEYSTLIRQFTQMTPESEEFAQLDRFLTLPPGVQEVFSRLPAGDRSALVIDSWDGLIEPYLGTAGEPLSSVHRLRLENALISVLSKANVHTILINETAAFTALEYLVHGVIELRRDDYEGMVLRELLYHKLRGVPLHSSSIMYSLEGARFTAVPRRFPRADDVPVEPFQVRENPAYGLSSGLAELDRTIGPLAATMPVLFEYDPHVERSSLRPMVEYMVAQAIRSGWEVTLMADAPFSFGSFIAEMEKLVPRAMLLEHLNSFNPPPLVASGTPTPPATRQLIEQLKESITTKSLVAIVLNSLESAFGSRAEFVDAVNSLSSRAHERGGILVYTVASSVAGLDEIASAVRGHFRFISHRRTTLMYGVRPSTPALAMLTNNVRGEAPSVWLLPIR
ncbi:MAG: gas vesicle protein GvpD P-loop domain-containing protein [Thermoplasmata archaeon]